MLALFLVGTVFAENSNHLVQGQIMATNKQPGSLATIQILDARQEKLLLQTKSDVNGNFSFYLVPGRYNLYVNGEFIQAFNTIGKPMNLNVQVEPYVLQLQKSKPLVVGGLAAGVAGLIAGVTAHTVTNSVLNLAEDDDGDLDATP